MSELDMSARSAPLRVLLLDDDSFLLELLSDMLEDMGNFTVLAESDARRALATVAAERPDLLVCDLSLPDMDGIEFLQAAARAGFAGCVMLLSGMDSGVRKAAERLARAHGLRVLGAFPKPITREALQAALAPLIDGQMAACPNGEGGPA
jgi:CheY-like chemotaxis protein